MKEKLAEMIPCKGCGTEMGEGYHCLCGYEAALTSLTSWTPDWLVREIKYFWFMGGALTGGALVYSFFAIDPPI